MSDPVNPAVENMTKVQHGLGPISDRVPSAAITTVSSVATMESCASVACDEKGRPLVRVCSGELKRMAELAEKNNIPRPEDAKPLEIKAPPTRATIEAVSEDQVQPKPAEVPSVFAKVGEVAPPKPRGGLMFPDPETGKPVDLLTLVQKVCEAKKDAERLLSTTKEELKTIVKSAQKELEALKADVDRRSRQFGALVTENAEKVRKETREFTENKLLEFSNGISKQVDRLKSAAERSETAAAAVRQFDNKFNLLDNTNKGVRQDIENAATQATQQVAKVRADFATALDALDRRKLDKRKDK